MTVQEAARRLGVSEGAVRKRVKRDTMPHDKAPDGRVYVYLDGGIDERVDSGVDDSTDALVSRLEGEVEFLREQLRRQQEILAQQAITMRQLSAPPEEPTQDAETVEEEPEGAEPRSDTGGAQEAAQGPERRSWWRRWFG